MTAALEVHDRIARTVFSQRDGYVFSTAGDSFAVAFARADDAVLAASELVKALAEVAWPTSVPLRVRVGAHTGEAQERDGDYFGPAVNRAARVMAAGHGGQVLVSETTAGVVGGVGVRLGDYSLRGFALPMGICQVGDGEFPPLRVSASSAGNLPPVVDEFVGRVSDVAGVVGLARRKGLVTVSGPGGMGKTRLAIEAATELALDLPDGGWFVDLATAAGPEAVVHLVISSVGVRVTEGDDLLGAVARHLGTRRAVVVLDNCEHVLDGVVELVDAVLAQGSDGVLLATSRERLGVRGEQVWPLDGLSVGEGVDLFVARAHSVDPRLDVDVSVVAQLCDRLDGMPLTIELAAARAGTMTPAELLENLDDRFRLLRGSRRRGSPSALRDTVEWSFGLLDEEQQTTLERLSVFAAPFVMDDAVALCQSEHLDRFDVIEVVGELTDRSLLVSSRTGDTTRFRMLETIRAFGHERLEHAGTRDAVQRAHAMHTAAWLKEVLRSLEGADDAAAVSELDRGWAELREAIRWSVHAGDVELAVELTAGLGVETQMRERREARDWIRTTASLDGAVEHPRSAELLASASIVDWVTGSYADGLARWQHVEDLRRQHPEILNAQIALAASQHYTTAGKLDRTMDILAGLRQEAVAAGQWFTEAYALATQVIGSSYAGETAGAQRYLDELRPLAGQRDNGHVRALTAFVETMSLVDTDPTACVEAARRALQLADEFTVPWVANMAANYLTYALIRSGDHAAATQQVLAVLEELAQGAAISALDNTARNCALLLAASGDQHAAATIGGWLTARDSIVGTAGMKTYTRSVIDSLHRASDPALTDSAKQGSQLTAEQLISYATTHMNSLSHELEPDTDPAPSRSR